MSEFLENAVFHNGSTLLKAKAFKGDNVIFARLNFDGTEFDYCIGCGCVFDGNNVSWAYGKYPMHHDWKKILKLLEACK